MDQPVLANEQELTCNSFVWTQNVIWKTCQEQFMIGTNHKRKLEKSALTAQLDDDDEE